MSAGNITNSEMTNIGAGGVSDSTFLIILRIHAGDIHLRHFDNLNVGLGKMPQLRVLCRNLSAHSDIMDPNPQVFVLDEYKTGKDLSRFEKQLPSGKPVHPSDLVMFMTNPLGGSKKASYAIEILSEPQNSSLEDLSEQIPRKIGAAYMYLDPSFSTQGTQRMQIMGAHSQAPIGQLQVDYLVVRNPKAYGVKVPRPDWINKLAQLDAGHRGSGSGCRGDLPEAVTENTVASFNYAYKHGADMCELDVMCTSDGVPVVYHNYTLNEPKSGSKQIDQLTLNELRAINDAGTHDKGCHHERNSTSDHVSPNSCKPFPTLEEVLKNVDKDCALNIELKWAQMLPDGKTEATQFREINDFVDRILNCIYEYSNGRAIVLSTFSADVAIMLRLKQTAYPVLFLTTGDSKRFNDPTTKSVINAIHFAQAFDLAGINPNAAHLTEYLVRYARERGLLVYAWGKIESAQFVKELRSFGLNGVIYDRIDLIKPQE